MSIKVHNKIPAEYKNYKKRFILIIIIINNHYFSNKRGFTSSYGSDFHASMLLYLGSQSLPKKTKSRDYSITKFKRKKKVNVWYTLQY